MFVEFPKMLYWNGGRTQGRVVHSAAEEKALNAEGWFMGRPLDENGEPVWPKEKGTAKNDADAPGNATVKDEAAAEEDGEKAPNLTKMSKAELVTYAKTKLGLELVPDSMTKAAMIEAIQGNG